MPGTRAGPAWQNRLDNAGLPLTKREAFWSAVLVRSMCLLGPVSDDHSASCPCCQALGKYPRIGSAGLAGGQVHVLCFLQRLPASASASSRSASAGSAAASSASRNSQPVRILHPQDLEVGPAHPHPSPFHESQHDGALARAVYEKVKRLHLTLPGLADECPEWAWYEESWPRPRLARYWSARHAPLTVGKSAGQRPFGARWNPTGARLPYQVHWRSGSVAAGASWRQAGNAFLSPPMSR